MPEKIYHVGIRVATGVVDISKLEAGFNSLGNWIRLNQFDWYLSSNKSMKEIHAVLIKLITTDDSMIMPGR